jgi:hypothetical protein
MGRQCRAIEEVRDVAFFFVVMQTQSFSYYGRQLFGKENGGVREAQKDDERSEEGEKAGDET